MKQSLFLLVLAFLISCKKDSPKILADQIIFGSGFPECSGDCDRFFSLTGSQLFADDCDFCGRPVDFKNDPLPQAKFDLASPLLNSVPSEILDIDQKRFGCPGCADGIVFTLIVVKNGVGHELQWDYGYENVPNEIRPYLEKVAGVVDSL